MLQLGRIHLRATAAKKDSVSRPAGASAVRSSLTSYGSEGEQAIQHPYTTLQLGRLHLLPTAANKGGISMQISTIHYALARSDSLTRYSSEGGQCQQATQHSYTTLDLGRIRLLATAANQGSISR